MYREIVLAFEQLVHAVEVIVEHLPRLSRIPRSEHLVLELQVGNVLRIHVHAVTYALLSVEPFYGAFPEIVDEVAGAILQEWRRRGL